MKLSFLLIVIFVILSFSSVAQSAKLKNEVSYSLECLYSGGQKNTMAKDKASILFYSKTKTAKCFTSCNFIDLKYTTKKNKFKYTSVIPGDVPCPDHLLGLEQGLKENFLKVNAYQILNNKIYFFDKKDTLMVFYE